MSYDNIRLDKGLYTSSKGFNAALEDIDPSENYKGTELEGLDAYQRQLKRFDIKVSGVNSDPVSKFFATTDSAALFPEYISRAVRQGINESNIVEQIVASVTKVDSLDYRAIESVSNENPNADDVIVEGAFIPETTIKTKETLTPLYKRGRMLTASYEAIKSQKLDIFTVALKQIGEYISACQLRDCVQSMLTDDIEVINFEDAEKGVQYTDLVKLWNSFNPYSMSTMLVDSQTMANLLNLPEFKDARAGQTFHGTGAPITPMGSQVLCVPMTSDRSIMALDKRYAVEMVQFGDIVTDFDRLIDRQLERASVTSTVGFSPIFTDAIKVMN
ncbi:MAG: phage major capsid protein [Eubacterium sp.]